MEKYIADVFGIWSIFRPQYMIGSGNNKDCEEWFFDRKCLISSAQKKFRISLQLFINHVSWRCWNIAILFWANSGPILHKTFTHLFWGLFLSYLDCCVCTLYLILLALGMVLLNMLWQYILGIVITIYLKSTCSHTPIFSSLNGFNEYEIPTYPQLRDHSILESYALIYTNF